MRKFAFRLERVLQLRKHEEEREKQRLAVLLAELQTARRRQAACERELAELEARFGRALARSSGDGELAVYELQLYRGRQELLRQNLTRAIAKVAEMQQRVDQQRALLLAAARRREVLVRLRKRKWEEFQREVLREEQKLLDEVASVWHYRQTGLQDA
ncbi:MAG: flagellar export protein FliJ [Limnochordales bacterium]|nr:flagellar export protein FliJ [Limnochordales bacterium]